MSALTAIFATVLQDQNGITETIKEIISIEMLIIGFGITGLSLSWIWMISLNSYLRVNSRKYAALKILEKRLEYQFFDSEWQFLSPKEQKQTYWQRSRIELNLPIVFFVCFWLLMGFGLFHTQDWRYHIFHVYPAALTVIFIFCFYYWLQIEKSFEGEDNDKERDTTNEPG